VPESLRVFAESLNNPVSYSSSWKGQQCSAGRSCTPSMRVTHCR
jgi:hypothetical protein